MNAWRICKKILCPPLWLLLLWTLIAIVLLVFSMAILGTQTVLAYSSYVLATYTLTAWCFRIPRMIGRIKAFRRQNRYARLWLDDVRLRTKLTLYGTLIWNLAYGALHLWLGLFHASYWFGSLATYYIVLAAMRFFLARYVQKNVPGEHRQKEWLRYRACGWILLAANLALTLMIFFMVYWNRSFYHDEIVTITMATYTFTSLTFAIVGSVRYRKYNSPVYSAVKAVSLASAGVSMLTMESTMLTTFGGESMTLQTRRLFLGLSGGAISAFIIIMAIYMIVRSTNKIKQTKQEESLNGKQST
ncbi:MAG: hypothetical protein IJY42_04155 [Clostridia bacterium]|nr:hypothetical protein [Clostridia bacterium]